MAIATEAVERVMAVESCTEPFIVSWNLTRLCNLGCGHCYLDAVQRRSEAADELGTGEALDVLGQLAELAPGAMLVLTGGEPLMRKDLPELVRRSAQLGLMPVIGSNGIMLDGKRAAGLRALGAAGVGISLDSATAGFHDRLRGLPGAWEGARRGMQAAREAGLAVLVQTTLFEENQHELAAIADIAGSTGAMALNFFFLVCVGRGVTQTDLTPAQYEETLSRIVRLQRERPHLMIRARCAPYLRRMLGLRGGEGVNSYAAWSSACLAGRSYLRITPQGLVTPCPYIPEVVGDVTTTPLREIWERHPLLMRLRTELPAGKCGTCDFRYSCGGCRARALARHGDVMAEDSNCPHVRPAGALPEAAPAMLARREGLTWEPAAEALLERMPAFIRGRVKARLEEYAASEAQRLITVDFMRAHRPPLRFPVHPSGNITGAQWPK
ncbi:MAG: radical SAM protein [Betaproteobacteria bacterium]|nr:radical SAM protein [Betaproteobacteria bacterium]